MDLYFEGSISFSRYLVYFITLMLYRLSFISTYNFWSIANYECKVAILPITCFTVSFMVSICISLIILPLAEHTTTTSPSLSLSVNASIHVCTPRDETSRAHLSLSPTSSIITRVQRKFTHVQRISPYLRRGLIHHYHLTREKHSGRNKMQIRRAKVTGGKMMEENERRFSRPSLLSAFNSFCASLSLRLLWPIPFLRRGEYLLSSLFHIFNICNFKLCFTNIAFTFATFIFFLLISFSL